MSRTLSKREPAAVRFYSCDFCGLSICPGERYVYYAGICEGNFTTARMHLHCDDQGRHGRRKDDKTC